MLHSQVIIPFQFVAGDFLYKLIQNSQLDFTDEIWHGVSIEARLFVKSLLEKDTKDRPSAAQIVTDPWVKTVAFTSEIFHLFCMHTPYSLTVLFSLLPVLTSGITHAAKLARYGSAVFVFSMLVKMLDIEGQDYASR